MNNGEQWVLVACPLCGSENRELAIAGNIDKDELSVHNSRDYSCTASSLGRYVDIARCTDCELMYLMYRPSDSILKTLVEKVSDETYRKEETGRYKTFANTLGNLNKLYPEKGRMLEIGCYTGVFLELARKSGWNVVGIEVSEWARNIAVKERNLDVLASLEKVDSFNPGSFDCVVMWDVIEHLPYPGEILGKIGPLLKKDGLFGLSTIMMDSLSARLLNRRYPFLMLMHLLYFTRKTITRTLEQAGLKIVDYQRHKRYVSYAYLFSKFPVISKIENLPFLWNFLSNRYFVSSIGVRDIFARKVA